MENDKSPGIDGIPIEFYKNFYEIIEKDLLQLYNNILFTEKKINKKEWIKPLLHLSPKKGNLNKSKYWRPISLVCLDYKILTKILSNKIETLSDIILEGQNCSIPQGTIFNDLFLVRDAIRLHKEKSTILRIINRPREYI